MHTRCTDWDDFNCYLEARKPFLPLVFAAQVYYYAIEIGFAIVSLYFIFKRTNGVASFRVKGNNRLFWPMLSFLIFFPVNLVFLIAFMGVYCFVPSLISSYFIHAILSPWISSQFLMTVLFTKILGQLIQVRIKNQGGDSSCCSTLIQTQTHLEL